MRHTVVAAALAGLLIGVGTAAAQGTKSDSVVKTTATADKPGADGKQVITVKLVIDKGWHAYANPAGDLGYATVVKVEDKKAEDVKVDYPKGQVVKDGDGTMIIWEDSAEIKVTVPRAGGDSPVKLKVKFQACNDKTCLLPATVDLTVP